LRIESIVGLGKAPEIMIAEDRVVIPISDSDLVIKRLCPSPPHSVKPLDTEASLLQEVRSRYRARTIARRDQQKRRDKTCRLHELHVVAGVEPSSRNVHRTPHPMQRSLQPEIGVLRFLVNLCLSILEMRRAAVEK
jgi:hypothetical protein